MEQKKSIVSIKSLPEVLDVSEMMEVKGGVTPVLPPCAVKGSGTIICILGSAQSFVEGPGDVNPSDGAPNGNGSDNGSGGGK